MGFKLNSKPLILTIAICVLVSSLVAVISITQTKQGQSFLPVATTQVMAATQPTITPATPTAMRVKPSLTPAPTRTDEPTNSSVGDTIAVTPLALAYQATQTEVPTQLPIPGAKCQVKHFDTFPALDSFTKGIMVRLSGEGNCDDGTPGSVRFLLDGESYGTAKRGTTSFAEDTDSLSVGNHEWCFLVVSKGDPKGSNAAKQCRTYRITPAIPKITDDGSCEDKLTPRLVKGGYGRVINGSIALRPRLQTGDSMMSLPEGTTFYVLSDYFCGKYNMWWQVSLNDGTIGWLPEGRSDDGYWLEPS